MKRLKKRWPGSVILGCILLSSPAVQAADNLLLKGALVNAPCDLRPGDEKLQLDFGSVVEKYLYSYTRTPGQQFELHLDNCDVSFYSGVKLTFNGTENTALPGLLAMDAASGAKGVAIGMETLSGQPLPLNQPGPTLPLQRGTTVVGVKAYVQGEPQAISQRTITPGAFSSSATFVLDYL